MGVTEPFIEEDYQDTENVVYFNFTTKELDILQQKYNIAFVASNYLNELNINTLIDKKLGYYIIPDLAYFPDEFEKCIKPYTVSFNPDIDSITRIVKKGQKILDVGSNVDAMIQNAMLKQMIQRCLSKPDMTLYYLDSSIHFWKTMKEIYEEEEVLQQIFKLTQGVYVSLVNTLPKNLDIRKLVDYIGYRASANKSNTFVSSKLLGYKFSDAAFAGLEINLFTDQVEEFIL